MRCLWLLLSVACARATRFAGEAERRVYFSYLEELRSELRLQPTPWERSLRSEAVLGGCKLHGNQSNCPLSGMPHMQSTVVQSGGNTRCIFDDSTPYAFQVIPADNDNLLLFFQGGGACYDEVTTEAGLCSTNALPFLPPMGMIDTSDQENPYQNYTVVVVLFCSGDVHTGNVVRDYKVGGSTVVQAGQNNTQSVLDWVREQQTNGGLAAELSELIIAGDSAGSLGAQIWAPVVANALRAKATRVVADSFLGVFPAAVGPVIAAYGVCGWFLSESLNEKCANGVLSAQDITMDTFERLGRHVPLLFINSKSDAVQLGFYELLALGEGGSLSEVLSPKEFYDACNSVLESFMSNNFAAFWISSALHTYTNHGRFYSTSIFGGYTPGNRTESFLSKWIQRLERDKIVCEECAGSFSEVSNTSTIQYCDAQLAEKCATALPGANEARFRE